MTQLKKIGAFLTASGTPREIPLAQPLLTLRENAVWTTAGLKPKYRTAITARTAKAIKIIRRLTPLLLFAIADVVAPPMPLKAQSLADSEAPSIAVPSTTPAQPEVTYARPIEKTKLRNYFFDAFGPYPIAGAVITAGVSQRLGTPPEWKQGVAGYGRRFGSDLGIAAISTTIRYALAEALHEDTLYYPCQCTGVFPRVSHAAISTFTARRGADGHRVFSFSAFVAPYAGTMTAVYGWYPARYDVKDALRMGNYTLLAYLGGNVAMEFFHSSARSWRSRLHMNNGHAASDPGSNP